MKKTLVILLGGLVLFAAAGFLLPREYRVERSIVIAAEPAAIYGTIADLGSWGEWTAWNTERDPTLTFEVTGNKAGAGSRIEWNGEMGSVKLSVQQADPAKGIQYRLLFDESQHSAGGLRMDADPGGTLVTWYNSGDLGRNPVNRWFGLLLDRLMGPDFEEGLAGLKARVEAGAPMVATEE